MLGAGRSWHACRRLPPTPPFHIVVATSLLYAARHPRIISQYCRHFRTTGSKGTTASQYALFTATAPVQMIRRFLLSCNPLGKHLLQQSQDNVMYVVWLRECAVSNPWPESLLICTQLAVGEKAHLQHNEISSRTTYTCAYYTIEEYTRTLHSPKLLQWLSLTGHQ